MKKKKQQVELVKINGERHGFITPVGTLSFPKLHKPVYNELSKKDEFSMDFIFDDAEDRKEAYKGKKKQTVSVLRAVTNARLDQWGEKEKWPKWTFDTFKKGNNNKNSEDEVYKGYEDKIYITLKSAVDYPPKIVGPDGNPIDEKEIWGGARVRAFGIARPVEYGKVIGVRFILQQVIKVDDGERFGGGGQEDVFDVEEFNEDIEDEDGEDEDF